MNFALPINQPLQLRQIVAIIMAVLLGGLIVILPIELAFLAIILSIIGILSFITPLSALAFALVVAPLRTLIQTESPVNLPLDIGQLAILFFIGVWALYQISHKNHLLKFVYSPILMPIIGFIFVSGLGVFYATSVGAWFTEWLKWVLIFALIIVIFSACRYNRCWEWVLFAVISAGFGQALIGLYTFWGGSGADHLRIFADRGFFRAFGSFGQPNPFGGFMGLLAPLSLMLAYAYIERAWSLWRKNQPKARFALCISMYYTIATLGIIGALVASWSRGAWLGLGVAILAVIVVLPRKLWQGVLLLSVVSLVGAVLWMSDRLPASLTERLASATQELFVLSDVRGVDINPENYAVIERLAHWQAALNMGRDNAWLGVGFGNYDATYETYRLINWKFSLGHAHNYYLNVLAETGIIGLIAYMGVLISLLMITWRTMRQHPDTLARITAIGLLGSWVYLMTHSMTDNLYVNNVFIHIGVMIGVLAIIHHPLIMREKVFIP